MDGEDTAFEAAVKLLARRASSEASLREKLRRKGHSDDDIDRACERLTSAGYLDDQRVALDVILEHDRRGLGPRRMKDKLHSLGVANDTIERAWQEARADHGVDPRQTLRDQLQRRLPDPASSCDEATVRRVYNALLRAGFDEAAVHAELAPYMPDQDAASDVAPADETTNDFPDP
jgi:regulatory protein